MSSRKLTLKTVEYDLYDDSDLEIIKNSKCLKSVKLNAWSSDILNAIAVNKSIKNIELNNHWSSP